MQQATACAATHAADALDDGPSSAPSAPEVLCFLAACGRWCVKPRWQHNTRARLTRTSRHGDDARDTSFL